MIENPEYDDLVDMDEAKTLMDVVPTINNKSLAEAFSEIMALIKPLNNCEAARILGINRGTIGDWRSGKAPKFETVKRAYKGLSAWLQQQR